MNKYFKRGFYPKNFILLGSDIDTLKIISEEIIDEAEKTFTDEFTGSRFSFPFELRYTPPFDKSFNELKRLQSIAADNSGYKDQYRGYIVIDVTGYLKHENDNYFDITLKFLYDMNAFWKYIFIVNSSNVKASLEITRTILNIIHCGVIDKIAVETYENKKYVSDICRNKGINCSEEVLSFWGKMIDDDLISRDTVYYVVQEMSMRSKITPAFLDADDLKNYLFDKTTSFKYMMTSDQYNKIIEAFEKLNSEGEKSNEKI